MNRSVALVVLLFCANAFAQITFRSSPLYSPAPAAANWDTVRSSQSDDSRLLASSPRPEPNWNSSSAVLTPMIAAVAPLPPRKSNPRIFDKKYLALLALSSAATIMDVELTTRCLSAHTCAEANPMYGRDPNRAKLYGISLPLMGGQVAISSWLKHRNPYGKAWILPMISGTAAHGIGALTAGGK